MAKPRVLLDTNIIISGLVFVKGNEHKILRLAEDKQICLALPEVVLDEVKQILDEKFHGFQNLFALYLKRVESEVAPFRDIHSMRSRYVHQVRNGKDLPIFAAVILSKPDFVVTGDKDLRDDLEASSELPTKTKVLTSTEFLAEIKSKQLRS